MIKVYYQDTIPQIPHLPLLYPNLGIINISTHIYENEAFVNFNNPFVLRVDDPAMADAILLPHDILQLKKHSQYITIHHDIARKFNKKLIIFQYGDVDKSIKNQNVILFLTSQYKTKKLDSEIIMPGYVADLGKLNGDILKKNKIPTIGFCGWANFENIKQKTAFLAKNLAIKVRSLSDRRNLNYLPGVVLRNQVLTQLNKSKLIKTNFILRKHYSGHNATIELNPQVARDEFVNNILRNDYSLAIKGSGNFSLRFFEILSLGRIPLLLDTDCCLPLEDIIPYSDFIEKFKLNEIHRW